jgi:hypothetical protein
MIERKGEPGDARRHRACQKERRPGLESRVCVSVVFGGSDPVYGQEAAIIFMCFTPR